MIERPQIESNVVRHCTNRCAACSHAAPWAEPYEMPPEVLRRDLGKIAPFIHAREFHVVGGEPLLHSALEKIVDVVNDSPASDLTVISTNGKLLPMVGDWLWHKIDVLRLSVYTNLDPTIMAMARGKCEQHGIRYDEIIVASFWKQFQASLDGASFRECPWKDLCLTLHDGWLFRCPQSAFFPPIINTRFALGVDGYPLNQGELTEQGIRDFLDSKVPLLTCHFCRSYTDQIDWHEVESRDQWLKDSEIE